MTREEKIAFIKMAVYHPGFFDTVSDAMVDAVYGKTKEFLVNRRKIDIQEAIAALQEELGKIDGI